MTFRNYVPAMSVLPNPANPESLTTIGTGHRLLSRYDGSATETSKIVFDNGF